MKDTICVAVGLAGGFFTAIFGGWDSALVTLVVFMAIDFFTGIITAMMKKSKHTESGGLSSKAGWFGLAKKVCTLMLIVVAVRMDILLNTNYIRRVCEYRDRCKSCGFSGFPMAAVGNLYHHHHRMHRHF